MSKQRMYRTEDVHSSMITLEDFTNLIKDTQAKYPDAEDFSLSTYDGYFELNFYRLETDEEYNLRLNIEKKQAERKIKAKTAKIEKELKQLARLKEKYEAK